MTASSLLAAATDYGQSRMACPSYSLPLNKKLTAECGGLPPHKRVSKAFAQRISEDKLVDLSAGFLLGLINRPTGMSELRGSVDLVALDMSIEFMKVCTLFPGEVVANPSKLVHCFLSEWHKGDVESYEWFLEQFGLSGIHPAPHEMQLVGKESTAMENARAYCGACFLHSCSPAEMKYVPNLFAIDSFVWVDQAPIYSVDRHDKIHGMLIAGIVDTSGRAHKFSTKEKLPGVSDFPAELVQAFDEMQSNEDIDRGSRDGLFIRSGGSVDRRSYGGHGGGGGG